MTLPFLPSPRFPKALVLRVLAVASGVQVEWSTAKRPALGLKSGAEKAWLLTSTSSMGNDGTDEERREYDAATDSNQIVTGGWRSCKLNLRAVSMDPTLEAFDLLGRVRFQLRTTKCAELYSGVLAVQEFHPIVPLDGFDVEGRRVLVATMDVGLGYVDQADPLDPQEGGYASGTDAANNGTLLP